MLIKSYKDKNIDNVNSGSALNRGMIFEEKFFLNAATFEIMRKKEKF